MTRKISFLKMSGSGNDFVVLFIDGDDGGVFRAVPNHQPPFAGGFQKRSPTLAPSAPTNSVAARRLRSRPLRYMIPETITNCREVRTGRSASGMGCAPIAMQIALVDLMRMFAISR